MTPYLKHAEHTFNQSAVMNNMNTILVNPLHLLIDNTTIERALQFDFLGLTLDENLNWKGHIDKISNKISKV